MQTYFYNLFLLAPMSIFFLEIVHTEITQFNIKSMVQNKSGAALTQNVLRSKLPEVPKLVVTVQHGQAPDHRHHNYISSSILCL